MRQGARNEHAGSVKTDLVLAQALGLVLESGVLPMADIE